MSLSHGDPASGNRPGCWGRSDVFDSESRECRGCGFNSTCRSQVIKMTINQQPTVPQVTQTIPAYYSPIPQPAHLPYQVPHSPVAPAPIPAPVAQVAPAPVSIQRYNPPAPAPVAPSYMAPRVASPQPTQPTQPVAVAGQPFVQDFYGRMQDPLFFQILSPPPFRSQMMGESFGERFFKNLMLDLGTMAFFHAGLALRQMFLPPQPPQPPEG